MDTTATQTARTSLSDIPALDELVPTWSQRAPVWGSEVLLVDGPGRRMLGDPGWEEAFGTPLAAWLAKAVT